MPDLSPQHAHLLALASQALHAARDRQLWRDVERAAEVHGAACDALWKELEDQIDENCGRIPVLEMPSVRVRKLAMRMRSEIIATVQAALSEAMDGIITGGLLDDDDA